MLLFRYFDEEEKPEHATAIPAFRGGKSKWNGLALVGPEFCFLRLLAFDTPVDNADLQKMSRTKKYGRLTDHIGDF